MIRSKRTVFSRWTTEAWSSRQGRQERLHMSHHLWTLTHTHTHTHTHTGCMNCLIFINPKSQAFVLSESLIFYYPLHMLKRANNLTRRANLQWCFFSLSLSLTHTHKHIANTHTHPASVGIAKSYLQQ